MLLLSIFILEEYRPDSFINCVIVVYFLLIFMLFACFNKNVYTIHVFCDFKCLLNEGIDVKLKITNQLLFLV